MPIRSRTEEARGMLARENAFCINGISLTTRLSPVRNASLEALLTGKYNVFSREAVDVVYVSETANSSQCTCYYASLWNLAAYGIENGADPYRSCGVLRDLADGVSLHANLGYIRLQFLTEDMQEDGLDRMPAQQYTDREIHPAITNEVLGIFAEEGILEDDAKTAVSALLRDGVIRQSLLKPGGPLFEYGNDRRHIVGRVLNYISSHRETPAAPLVPTENAFDPAIDVITGRSVGVP